MRRLQRHVSTNCPSLVSSFNSLDHLSTPIGQALGIITSGFYDQSPTIGVLMVGIINSISSLSPRWSNSSQRISCPNKPSTRCPVPKSGLRSRHLVNQDYCTDFCHNLLVVYPLLLHFPPSASSHSSGLRQSGNESILRL